MFKDLIKKRIVPFGDDVPLDDLVYRNPIAPLIPGYSNYEGARGAKKSANTLNPELTDIQAEPTPVNTRVELLPEIPLPTIDAPATTPPFNPNSPLLEISDSQRYFDQMKQIQDKDYSIRKIPQIDTEGNVIGESVIRGKDRKKSWGLADKLGAILTGIGTGFLKGGVLGAAVEGVKGGTDRNYMSKFADAQKLPEIQDNYRRAVMAENVQAQQDYNTARTANIYADNTYQNERLEEARQERQRKVDDRRSREKTSRMNAVAGMFKNIPEFIPGDPRYADIEKALGGVDLPITPKDAKKNVKLVQDQRTGAWSTVLTNPLDGTQETRPVLDKSGKQLATTPTVVMQGEYGMLRQNDQQEFTRTENDKDRNFRLKTQEIDQKFRAKQAELDRAERDARDATNEQQKIDAENRAKEARKEILQYQQELQKERDLYKKSIE